MDNNLNISKSTESEQAEILTLLDSAKGNNLTAEERSKQGFIQGRIDAALLNKFQNGLGVYIAKINQEIVAAALTSTVGITSEGPNVEALNTIFGMYKELAPEDIFLYGPVVVKSDSKGKGLLTKMLLYICSAVGKYFKKGLAFVDEGNQLSLAIHRHYFEKETATFLYRDRKYYAFLFDPKVLLVKYGKES